jgi:hypothetical protein
MSPFTCGWPNGFIIGHNSNKFAMYVLQGIQGVATMLVCDHHSKGWHMGSLTPSLFEVP